MPSGGRPRRLRVGPLEATWERGGLRWITVDGTEIIRGIQLTARDADWRTLTAGDDRSAHRRRRRVLLDHVRRALAGRAIRSRWACCCWRATSRAEIEARLSARIGSASVVQRLGLVVLHPATVAGRPFEASGDVGETRGVFPVLVSADRFASEIRSLRWEPSDGLRAALRFDGEPWETEDQRAWTDASFKSYAPPLSRPHPVTLPAGSMIDTAVRLDVTRAGGPHGRIPSRRRPALRRVRVRDASVASLPPIGFGWSGPLGTDEAERLRALAPRPPPRRRRPRAVRLADGPAPGQSRCRSGRNDPPAGVGRLCRRGRPARIERRGRGARCPACRRARIRQRARCWPRDVRGVGGRCVAIVRSEPSSRASRSAGVRGPVTRSSRRPTCPLGRSTRSPSRSRPRSTRRMPRRSSRTWRRSRRWSAAEAFSGADVRSMSCARSDRGSTRTRIPRSGGLPRTGSTIGSPTALDQRGSSGRWPASLPSRPGA